VTFTGLDRVRDVLTRSMDRFDSTRERGHWCASLTGREREVLALTAEGRFSAATARALTDTPRTVESHVRQIKGSA
jgi:DNA-binding CsgD family transcriptional regulator